MSLINIYTVCSYKGIRKGDGAFLYILETETEYGPATVTHRDEYKDMTANEMYLSGIIGALKHITKPCERICVCIESQYIETAINQWLPSWIESDFKKSNGAAVSNADKWRELVELLKIHGNYSFWNEQQHEYRRWLKNEVMK